VRLDARDIASIARAVATIDDAWGGLDVLVNNAGLGMRTVNPAFLSDPQPFWQVTEEGFTAVIDTNLTGYFRVAAPVVPLFLRHGGSEIANPRFFRRDEKALVKAQRRLAREPKPAKGERATPARLNRRKVVARVHERIANRRKDFAHQQSRRVVETHDPIAVEDLSINRMVHNHCLAKSISDAAWSMFTSCLSYKAANAGRRYIAVDPAYTSQTCSRCGHRQKMPLSDRVYFCPCCHLELSCDHNAAINIVTLGVIARRNPAI